MSCSSARVLPTDVDAIYPNVVEDPEEFSPFIEAAHVMVEEELAGAGLSEARLKLIELYLSAHFATITLERGGLVKQKIGDSEEMYQTPGFNTVGLVTTRFGQQVVILDTSGTMAALAQNPVKAEFRVIGAPKKC